MNSNYPKFVVIYGKMYQNLPNMGKPYRSENSRIFNFFCKNCKLPVILNVILERNEVLRVITVITAWKNRQKPDMLISNIPE